MITNQRQLRRLFWEGHPELNKKKIKSFDGKGKMYVADTRMAWVDFIDMLHRDRQISDALAYRAELR